MTAMTVENAVALIAFGLHQADRSHSLEHRWEDCPSQADFATKAACVIQKARNKPKSEAGEVG